MKSREVRLTRYPTALPTPDCFQLAEVELPPLEVDQVQVRNLWMSVDPYMRGRMRPGKSYVPPFKIGQALLGGAVGQVTESRHSDVPAGACVRSMQGWREAFVADADSVEVLSVEAPLQAYLGVLGMPGMTAYTGLLKIGQAIKGETVLVSAATGAVGSLVCQIARLQGCRVIGSAGSKEKVAWLMDKIGVDGAFNYKEVEDLGAEIGRLCPDGVDVYFENVGGDFLEATIGRMNDFGRIVVCGMISLYNDTTPRPGPGNLFQIITKRLRVEGFLVFDHWEEYPTFLKQMVSWIESGDITWRETVVDGLENAPQALIGLFQGDNLGKMLVRLGD